jgi:hypothetical protein
MGKVEARKTLPKPEQTQLDLEFWRASPVDAGWRLRNPLPGWVFAGQTRYAADPTHTRRLWPTILIRCWVSPGQRLNNKSVLRS